MLFPRTKRTKWKDRRCYTPNLFNRFFAANPAIEAYFVNAGFASLCHAFATDDGRRAGALFVRACIRTLGLGTPWVAGAAAAFTRSAVRFTSSLRELFLRELSRELFLRDRSPGESPRSALAAALTDAACDLTPEHRAVWACAFKRDSAHAAAALVRVFLSDAVLHWRFFPEFARTPFSLASLAAELASLPLADCAALVGPRWPPPGAGHAPASPVPDGIHYALIQPCLSWLDAFLLSGLAALADGACPFTLNAPPLSLELAGGADPFWAALYLAETSRKLCQSPQETAGGRGPQGTPAQQQWWRGIVATASARGLPPQALLPDRPTPLAVFGLARVAAALERTGAVRATLRDRLVQYDELCIRERELRESTRAAAVAYARRFPLPTAAAARAVALRAVAVAAAAEQAVLATRAPVPAQIALRPDAPLGEPEAVEAVAEAVAHAALHAKVQSGIAGKLARADALLFGYAVREIGARGAAREAAGPPDRLYSDPRSGAAGRADEGRPQYNTALVDAGDLALVVGALLTGFDAVDAERDAGLDLIAFKRVHELLRSVEIEGCEASLLRHYWFGKFNDGGARDDEATQARAAFARRLGLLADILRDGQPPVPKEFREAIDELDEWFVAKD